MMTQKASKQSSYDIDKSFNKFRLNREVCDGLIISSDGRRFPIHRIILCRFSSYFKAYFTNILHIGNPELSEMVISDLSSDIISLIIDFAYTKTCEVTSSNVQSLMVAADRFCSDSLVSFCSDFITKRIDSSNCIPSWQFARNMTFKHLEEKAWQVTLHSFVDVMSRPEFCTLNLEEVRLLLSADEVNVSREQQVFEAVALWVQHDPKTRRKHVAQLFHCIRFGYISVDFFDEFIKPFQYNTKESLDFLLTVEILLEDCDYKNWYFRPRIPEEVVFAFGGWTEGTPTNAVETYDKKSDQWFMSNIRDETIRAYHGVVTLNNLIYVIGGYDGVEYFNTVHCFDPATDTWRECACMHDLRCYGCFTTLGDEIYAMGGHNGHHRLDTVEKYCPASNQWRRVCSMNSIRSDAGAAALNYKIYVAGGFNGDEVLNSVEVYSPWTDTWRMVRHMLSPRSGVNLITHNSHMYVIGGFNARTRLTSCERYNPKYDWWETIASMNMGRSNMASVILDNSIYVIGGYNGHSTMANSEYYDESNNIWYESGFLNVNRSALGACVLRGLPNARTYTALGVYMLQFI